LQTIHLVVRSKYKLVLDQRYFGRSQGS